MTPSLSPHSQRSIHMHIMTREIQCNQTLKQHRMTRHGQGEKNQQTSRRAAIGNHIQHGAETCGLGESSRCETVEGVEETADAVEGTAAAGVEGHVVEGEGCEEDADVAWSERIRRVCVDGG